MIFLLIFYLKMLFLNLLILAWFLIVLLIIMDFFHIHVIYVDVIWIVLLFSFFALFLCYGCFSINVILNMSSLASIFSIIMNVPSCAGITTVLSISLTPFCDVKEIESQCHPVDLRSSLSNLTINLWSSSSYLYALLILFSLSYNLFLL